MPPSLPTELWLSVLQHIPPQDLWLNTRHVNTQLHSCTEDILLNIIIPSFTISLALPLGTGTRARWYDIRGSISLCFTSISKRNPQYALFDNITIAPESRHQRAWEKWNQICSAGVGDDILWRVQLCRDTSDKNATHGSDMRAVKLQNLIISEDHGVWCDWRELMHAYFDHVSTRAARRT